MLAFAGLALAQNSAQTWRKIGNSAVDLGLASPATGPVSAVWFSPGGSVLYARTQSGKVFASSDMETWTAAPDGAAPPQHSVSPAVHHLPEPGAAVRAGRDGRTFAIGSNVYASDDGGRSWTDLTGFNNRSVIGAGEHDLAVSPNDSQLIVVANDFGVWRSHDGGLSWSGLNENLPNLEVREIVNPTAAVADLRVTVSAIGTVEPDTVLKSWRPVALPAGDAARAQVSAALRTQVTALAGSGDTWYAGTWDGRLWVSTDRRTTWTISPVQATGVIERIYADPEAPRIAFAAASGTGPHVFRTINSGLFWDDITGSLADAPAHGITADRAGGAVYVATDRGVFLSRMDVNSLGAVSPWISVNASKGTDVKLDPAGNVLFVALDGYGVFSEPAPHRAGMVRLLNSADLSQRAAAPGSLYSIVGSRVQSVSSRGTAFPVLAASDESSQVQVPFEVTGSQIDVTIQRSAGPLTLGLAVKPVSPAIFLDRDGAPMLLDGGTGLMMDAGSAVHPRVRLQVLATGFGKVTPAWPSGMPAPLENPPAVAAKVQAFLNATPVEVTRATLAPGYVGLYLIEIQLPALLDSGTAELFLTADGQESNHVRIVLESAN